MEHAFLVRLDGQEEILSIKRGTMNDAKWLCPVAHIWTESAQPWLELGRGSLMSKANLSGFDSLTETLER